MVKDKTKTNKFERYRKYKRQRQLLRTFLVYFVSSIVLTVIYYVAFSPIFDTKRESNLKQEYLQLESNYDSLKTVFTQTKTVLDNLERHDTLIYRSIFKANPLGISKAMAQREKDSIRKLTNKDVVENTFNNLNILSAKITANDKRMRLYVDGISDSLSVFKNIPSIQPVENSDFARTGASVGMKIHPFYRVPKIHKGIDFVVPLGSKVFATADGFVETVLKDDSEKGSVVVINHGNGFKTVYAHLGKIITGQGKNVEKGDIIALSGNSGMSLWPHLHYEVLKDGKFIDPIICFFAELNPYQMNEIRSIASNNGQSLD